MVARGIGDVIKRRRRQYCFARGGRERKMAWHVQIS
jgi:hypothetical protein